MKSKLYIEPIPNEDFGLYLYPENQNLAAGLFKADGDDAISIQAEAYGGEALAGYFNASGTGGVGLYAYTTGDFSAGIRSTGFADNGACYGGDFYAYGDQGIGIKGTTYGGATIGVFGSAATTTGDSSGG